MQQKPLLAPVLRPPVEVLFNREVEVRQLLGGSSPKEVGRLVAQGDVGLVQRVLLSGYGSVRDVLVHFYKL